MQRQNPKLESRDMSTEIGSLFLAPTRLGEVGAWNCQFPVPSSVHAMIADRDPSNYM